MATQPLKNPGRFKIRSGKVYATTSTNPDVMAKSWKRLITVIISEYRHHLTKVAKYAESRANCSHCKKEFQKRYGEANQYCSNDCFNEFRIQIWLPCSICHAGIGIGSQTSGKIIGISDSSIRKQWKKKGIVSEKKGSVSTIQQGRVMVTESIQKVKEYDCKHEYEKACMKDIRSHVASFDWSYLWLKEVSKIKMRERYRSFTKEEKTRHNSEALKNRDKQKQRQTLNRWKKQRMKDPVYRMVCGMRSRLSTLMRGANVGGYEALVGCTIEQLRNHIESAFKRGMTWENYGTHWHVDHILPVASFDQSNQDHRARCWHWTNLRPLTATQNLRKSDTITEPQMSLTLCSHH